MDPNQPSKHDAIRQRQLEREQIFTALVLEPRSRWYRIGGAHIWKWPVVISTLLIAGFFIGLSLKGENHSIQPREFRESLGSNIASLPNEDATQGQGLEPAESSPLTKQSETDSSDKSRTGQASDPKPNQESTGQIKETEPKTAQDSKGSTVVILGKSSSKDDPGQEDVFPTVKLSTVQGVIAYEVMVKKGNNFISAGTFLPEAGIAPATVKLNLKVKKGSVLDYRIVLHRADGSSESLEIRHVEIK